MTRKHSILILTLSILAACASPNASTPAPVPANTAIPTEVPTYTVISTQTALAHCTRAGNLIQQACTSPAEDLSYWAYVPSDQSTLSSAGLPLLVYLHGSNQIGSNLQLLLSSGLPSEIEKGRDLAMMVVSPQCPYGENWQTAEMVDRLSRFVDDLVSTYHLDPSRVYLTGFSMGGDGVWAVGKAHPEQFAALAPVSSDWYGDDPADLCVLRDLPVWVFQSNADEVVSPKYAHQNVAQIQGCGGSQIQLTLFPSGGHEATARQVYAMDELYRWFLEQKRGARSP